MSELTPQEIERYARHIVLPEVGGPGQARLKAARVLVVGAGGLGAPVIQYLAAAGVGRLRVVDDDAVSLSNLQRQVIHDAGAVGEAKVASAARSVARLNPYVEVEPHRERLMTDNAASLLEGCDLAVDGSDNFATRYVVADACREAAVPLVTGAVGRFDGSVTLIAPDGPSYRDVFPQAPPEGMVPTCAEAGILGALTGVVGSLMAMEALKWLTDAGEPLVGRLLLYDGLSARVDVVRYRSARAG